MMSLMIKENGVTFKELEKNIYASKNEILNSTSPRGE